MIETRSSILFRLLVAGLILVGLFSSLITSQVQADNIRRINLPDSQQSLFFPLEVIINEVAWSGTVSDPTGEWMELYNPGEVKIDLLGWKLVADDGDPVIDLSGEIPAGGYYLLERRDDLTISDITADQIYDGELDETDETLRLFAPNTRLIDSANRDGGDWPAGSAFPDYASMERISVVPDSNAAWGDNNGVVKNGKDIDGKPVRGTPHHRNSLYTAPENTPTATAEYTPTRTKSPTPTFPPPNHLVISQFRTRGPNGEYDEFVELFNPGNAPVNIGSWQIKKSSDCRKVITSLLTIPSGVILLSGQRYLAASQRSNLQGSDQVFSLPISDGGGLALVQTSGSIVDQVGLCADTSYLEGHPLVPLNGDYDQGYARKPVDGVRGCLDTNRNSEDFYLISPSNPKGRSGAINMCPGVKTATPTIVRPTSTPLGGASPLMINEILPRAGTDWNGDGTVNVEDEFIEIINIGSKDVSLKGCKLDDSDGGSSPFPLPDISLLPGELEVFFGKETGLILNDIGDSVRLLRPNSQLVDTFTYPTVIEKDKSWCRHPDGEVVWKYGCLPTPDQLNKWEGASTKTPAPGENNPASGQGILLCPFAETLPVKVFLSRCSGWGENIWNLSFWKAEVYFPLMGMDKWGVIIH